MFGELSQVLLMEDDYSHMKLYNSARTIREGESLHTLNPFSSLENQFNSIDYQVLI